MEPSNIIVPAEAVQLFDERKRLRQSQQAARGNASKLEQFSSQVASYGSPQQLPLLTTETTPPGELEAVLPRLEQSLAEIRQTEQRIQEHRLAIEEIKRQAKNLQYLLIGSTVLVVLILVIILVHAL